jgi:hypothetical protein
MDTGFCIFTRDVVPGRRTRKRLVAITRLGLRRPGYRREFLVARAQALLARARDGAREDEEEEEEEEEN